MITLLTPAGRGQQEPCDLVLRARRIHGVTADEGGSFIAWRRGSIVAAGPSAGAPVYERDAVRRVAMPRALVTPGLVDAHAHLLGLGDSLERIDLVGTSSYAEVIAKVAAAARKQPAGTWILGRGWDQNDWREKRFPHHEDLSRAVPDHPVWLTRIDGHAALANQAAMERAGVGGSSAVPEGGRMLRDGRGEPTGVFIDRAMDLIGKFVVSSARPLRERYLRAQRECLAAGLVGVHDAGVSWEQIGVIRKLIAEGRWHLRIYAMLPGRVSGRPLIGFGKGLLTVRAVKLYADGALGSRGAALIEDYSDEPGNRGLLVIHAERLEATMRKALEQGFQVCVHAIGDRGNRLVIDTYEKAIRSFPKAHPRFRLEHAQILALEDIPRIRRLGLIASMQPTHCTSDMDWAGARIGPGREAGAYAWRKILAAGIPLAFGSDFPVERVDPRLGLYAALTRMHPDGTPRGGWHPEECLRESEAIDAFSAGAAYAAFEEGFAGRIAPGYRADLTVFDPDPLLLGGAEGWLKAPVRWTVVGGEVVYEANSGKGR